MASTNQLNVSKIKPLVYISGPYTGDIGWNIVKARAMTIKLWEMGFAVICPHLNTAHFEQDCDATYEDFLEGDLRMIEGCDVVLMLEGWAHSEGARKEAEHTLEKKIPVFYDLHRLVQWGRNFIEESKKDKKSTVLDRAKALVFGDRGEYYGHPGEDFARTAGMWAAMTGFEFKPEHVALFMVALKLSREMNRHKCDNLVDIAGYAETCAIVVGDD